MTKALSLVPSVMIGRRGFIDKIYKPYRNYLYDSHPKKCVLVSEQERQIKLTVMMNPKNILADKAKRFDDDMLIKTLNHNATKEEIKDWKNWTDPFLKSVAKEANKRELI